jgi:hypothetical protein
MKHVAGIQSITIKAKRGIDGKTPTVEELSELIKPLIPAPLQGEKGIDGKDGRDGIDGINGKDGIDGKDGVDGKDGKDGVDGKDADVSEFIVKVRAEIQEKTTEHLNFLQRSISSKTYDIGDISGLQEALDDIGGVSFETVSKNLKAYPNELNYTGDNLTSIVYDLGGGLTITKTLSYTGDNLTEIELTGDIPDGISTVKSLLYTGDNLSQITYS